MNELESLQDKRVVFERSFPVRIMAVDGTWQRSCQLHDIADASATLVIEGSVTDLSKSEFFLLFSSIGLVYRRCQLERVHGEYVGVRFLNRGTAKNKYARASERLLA